MRIAIGSDHRGFPLKQHLLEILKGLGHQCEDVGCYDENSVDYPDIAGEVARRVTTGEAEHGVLVCSTGTGVSISANKVKGIRAALCHDVFSAQIARKHNDANVVCMGGWVVGKGLAEEILKAYLDASFEGGRHQRRVNKIKEMESTSEKSPRALSPTR